MKKFFLGCLVIILSLFIISCVQRIENKINVKRISDELTQYQWATYNSFSRQYKSYNLVESINFPNVLQIHTFKEVHSSPITISDETIKDVQITKIYMEDDPTQLKNLVINGKKY